MSLIHFLSKHQQKREKIPAGFTRAILADSIRLPITKYSGFNAIDNISFCALNTMSQPHQDLIRHRFFARHRLAFKKHNKNLPSNTKANMSRPPARTSDFASLS